MAKTVAVISRFNNNLIPRLKELLPAVNFVEVQLSDPSPLYNAEIILGDYDYVGPHLYKLQNTKWLQGTWAGLDYLFRHIEKDKIPKFPITRISGENFGQLMSEYAIANIVSWERNLHLLNEHQKKKKWDKFLCEHDHRAITDLKIAILGIGSIGNIIGQTLHSMGATIYGYGRRENIPLESEEYKYISKYFNKSTLPELLGSVDYIINVLPTTAETTNLLGNGMLEYCKGRVTFMNIGRGSIIKESELVHALQQKWIAGAILDVFEKEPLPKDSLLWDLPNVRVTPHIAGISRTPDIAAKFKKNFELYTKNLPLINQVDFEKGY